jgi:lysozyme family protein
MTTVDLFVGFITPVIQEEGGYSDNPADAGGPTRYGITEATARANGYNGDMQTLPMSIAISIYRDQFYVKPQFDQMAAISADIAKVLVNLGVNMGVTRPGEFLQRALNVLRLSGSVSLFTPLKVDGELGAITRTAAQRVMAVRGGDAPTVLVAMILAQASVYYIALAEASPTQDQFEYGWQTWRVAASLPAAIKLPSV